MTLPEVLLWQQLRRQPNGLKSRRQHPVDPYVADFFCGQASLIIEIDGLVHGDPEAAARDEIRDARLRERGLAVLRVPAAEILRDPAAVATFIIARAGNPLHQPSAGPPPRSGEE